VRITQPLVVADGHTAQRIGLICIVCFSSAAWLMRSSLWCGLQRGTTIAPHLACDELKMTDRRRAPRYVLETRLTGDAMPMEDVMVEHFSGDRLVVVSLDTHAVKEDLLVYLAMPHGLETHRATVMSSTPVSVGGQLCCRVELCITDAERSSRREGNTPSVSDGWKH
jgi:hypothetical protein